MSTSSTRLSVAVLMGGISSEREISLRTGEAVCDALASLGHRVVRVVLGDLLAELEKPQLRSCDVIFVALHGGAGEDGRVQAVLELAGLAYVGSGPGACAVAMDKIWTKHVCRSIGVPTAPWAELEDASPVEDLVRTAEPLGWPIVLKPVDEGSTVGVTIAPDAAQLQRAWGDPGRRRGRWMLERYVEGRELTLPVLLGQAMAEIEMRPREGFYDYANKYTAGRTQYDCPAVITPEQRDALVRDGMALYRALGLRDMARIDFRMDPQGQLFCLEANAIPGMTATSLLPMGARAKGIEFPQMCEQLCRAALGRAAHVDPAPDQRTRPAAPAPAKENA